MLNYHLHLCEKVFAEAEKQETNCGGDAPGDVDVAFESVDARG